MSKIIKNTTVATIAIESIGLEIAAGDAYTIVASENDRWAEIDVITEISPLITSGDIVVNDGNIDLPVIEAINFIKYPDNTKNTRFDVPDSTEGDFGTLLPLADESTETAIRNSAKVVRVSSTDTRTRHLEDKIVSGPGINVVKVVNGVTGEETLELDSTGNFIGKGFQTTFAGNGVAKNQWLSQEDTNVESNESPDVFKYGARLVGIDFTNQNQNPDSIIIMAIKSYPFTNVNNPDRFYKWTLSNARSAVKTNQSLGFTVNAGDVMAVYIKDGGGDANDCIITMDFIILDASDKELQFNYSQDFHSNDLPATNLIPEVLA